VEPEQKERLTALLAGEQVAILVTQGSNGDGDVQALRKRRSSI